MYKTQYTLKKQFTKKKWQFSSPDFVAHNTEEKRMKQTTAIEITAKNHLRLRTSDFSSLFILLIFHLKGKCVSGTKIKGKKRKTWMNLTIVHVRVRFHPRIKMILHKENKNCLVYATELFRKEIRPGPCAFLSDSPIRNSTYRHGHQIHTSFRSATQKVVIFTRVNQQHRDFSYLHDSFDPYQ